MAKNHTISEVVGKRLMPVSKRQLLDLLKFWKMKAEWTLPDGYNYLLGSNVGNWTKRARWEISDEEIEAWRRRAKVSPSPKKRKEMSLNPETHGRIENA